MVCSLNDSSCNWSAGDSAHFQRMYTILFAVGICVLILLVWACCICPYICQMSKKTVQLDLTDTNEGTVGGMREHALTHAIQGGKLQVVGNKLVNGATSDTSSDDSFADGQDVSRNIEEVSFETQTKNNKQSFAIEIV